MIRLKVEQNFSSQRDGSQGDVGPGRREKGSYNNGIYFCSRQLPSQSLVRHLS